jgi:hypothetical protein
VSRISALFTLCPPTKIWNVIANRRLACLFEIEGGGERALHGGSRRTNVLKRREREIEAPLIEAPTCFVKSRTESYLPRCVSLLTARARRGLTGQSSGQRRALACSVTNDAVAWLVRIARRFVVVRFRKRRCAQFETDVERV